MFYIFTVINRGIYKYVKTLSIRHSMVCFKFDHFLDMVTNA